MAALVLPPLWSLVMGSLHRTTETGATGDFTFDYYRRLLADRHFFESLANSVIFGLGSAALAIVLRRRWSPGSSRGPMCRSKASPILTAIVSLGTPFVLYVSAWLFVLGRGGPLNDLLQASGATSRSVQCLFASPA